MCGGVGGGRGRGGKEREKDDLSMKARVYMSQLSLSMAAVWFTCSNGGSLSVSSFPPPPLLPSAAVSVLQDRDRPFVRLVSCLL